MREITELTPDLIGKQVSCRIHREVIKEATIVTHPTDKEIYGFAQSIISGADWKSNEKHNHHYVWSVLFGTSDEITKNSVIDIVLLEDYETDYTPFI